MTTTSNETLMPAAASIGGAPAATGEAVPGAPASGDWRDALPTDLRGAARNFRLPADAVKSARDLRQKLSTMIAVPGEASSAGEVAEFRKRIGVPDAPDGYALQTRERYPAGVEPQSAKVAETDFVRAMHGAGATPAVVQAALDWYWGTVDEAGASAGVDKSGAGTPSSAPAGADAVTDAEAALRKAWGRTYDDNLVLARRVIGDYGGGEFAAHLDRTGLGNSVALANALADLGRYRAEDTLFGGGGAASAGGTEDRLNEIMSRADYWTDAGAQREAREITERLYGTNPIAGKPGR